jgi:hypothetical protein
MPGALAPVLEWHLRHYPLLQAQDVYKLLHQGVFGPGHIISDPGSARRYLNDEFAALPAHGLPEVEDVEPIDPDGMFVRVNLAPLAGRPEELPRLAEALLAGAQVPGTRDEMGRRLTAAREWYEATLPLVGAELAGIAEEARSAGFPALHHTSVYVQAYKPAYRVVLSRLWPQVEG